MKTWTVPIIFALMVPCFAIATEVDNFTDRDLPLSDSRGALNQKMNVLISATAEKVNSKYDCSLSPKKAQERFYKSLNKKIGGFFYAKYELDVERDPSIDKRHFKRRESIYQTLTIRQALALRIAALGSVVNVGGHKVGTDKLGHFIGIGKIYFDIIRKNKGGLKDALAYGEKSERTFFGLHTTGVYSYGDLVSNYEGLLFWQSLFNGQAPYMNCEDGVLVQVRSFDWLDYVNEAWDEAVNCSAFRTESIMENVNAAAEVQCPLAPLLPETVKRYSSLPSPLLNEIWTIY